MSAIVLTARSRSPGSRWNLSRTVRYKFKTNKPNPLSTKLRSVRAPDSLTHPRTHSLTHSLMPEHVHMCECMHTCMSVCLSVCLSVCRSRDMHGVCMCVHVEICLYMSAGDLHAYLHTYLLRTYIYTCRPTDPPTYLHTCISTCIHAYILT